MFTGIVEEIGIIAGAQQGRLCIAAGKVLEGMKLGDSIAVNGACLTVSALTGNTFSVEVMPETLRHTNLGMLCYGDGVNLERALALGGRLGGHLVQGHVDATGKVVSLEPEDKAILAKYAAPPEVIHYVVEKGFVAVDGVSLTIIDRDATSFKVSLVTFTQQNTTLGNKRPGTWST